MNFFFKLCLSLFFLTLISCEQIENRTEIEAWQGTTESFEEEFSYQTDQIYDSAILRRNGSNESYSGSLEINQSGRITKQNYVKGRLNGRSIKKSADGSWVQANYVDGKLDGPMKLFDSSGELRSTLIYSQGKLLPSKTQ